MCQSDHFRLWHSLINHKSVSLDSQRHTSRLFLRQTVLNRVDMRDLKKERKPQNKQWNVKMNTVLVINNRPAGKEVTGTRKKGVREKLEKMKKREVKVQFKRDPLIILHSPD